MINLLECELHETIDAILSTCLLSKVIGYESIDKTYSYILIRDDFDIIGCFNFRALTSITAEVHINILPQFWGKNHAIPAVNAGFDWFKSETKFTKIFTDVPEVCNHVHKLLKTTGFEPCGQIKNGCIYDNQPTNLILYNFDLNRSEYAI